MDPRSKAEITREFLEFLKDKIDVTGDDITVEFPPDDPNAECLDVTMNGRYFCVYVSHTNIE